MCIFCRMCCTDRMENQAAGEKITVNEHDSDFYTLVFHGVTSS